MVSAFSIVSAFFDNISSVLWSLLSCSMRVFVALAVALDVTWAWTAKNVCGAHALKSYAHESRVLPRSIAMESPLSRSWKAELDSDDWQYFSNKPTWLNPCFFTCMTTGISVQQAIAKHCFSTFGIGPLLVLLSSVMHWQCPEKTSWRRQVDIVTVRTRAGRAGAEAPRGDLWENSNQHNPDLIKHLLIHTLLTL